MPKKREFERETGLSSRILAFIIDTIVIDVIIISAFSERLEIISIGGIRTAITNPFMIKIYMSTIPLFILIVAYFFLFEYLIQTTPGKFLLGIIVKDKNGKAPNAWKCFLKNMLYYPNLLFLIWWVIDIYYLVRHKERLTEKLLNLKTVQVIEW